MKCISTIQFHVVDTHPEHQDLIISGRDINGLKMQCFKVAPLHVKTLMYAPFNNFALELKNIKNPDNKVVKSLKFIDSLIETWRNHISNTKKIYIQPQPNLQPATIYFNAEELKPIVKCAEFFNKKLLPMASSIIDADDASLFMENNKIINYAISQLRLPSGAVEGLLDKIKIAFMMNDFLCETYIDEYKLSFKIEELIKSIERQIENIRKAESNIKREIHSPRKIERLVNSSIHSQRLFVPNESALKQERKDVLKRKERSK